MDPQAKISEQLSIAYAHLYRAQFYGRMALVCGFFALVFATAAILTSAGC